MYLCTVGLRSSTKCHKFCPHSIHSFYNYRIICDGNVCVSVKFSSGYAAHDIMQQLLYSELYSAVQYCTRILGLFQVVTTDAYRDCLHLINWNHDKLWRLKLTCHQKLFYRLKMLLKTLSAFCLYFQKWKYFYLLIKSL